MSNVPNETGATKNINLRIPGDVARELDAYVDRETARTPTRPLSLNSAIVEFVKRGLREKSK